MLRCSPRTRIRTWASASPGAFRPRNTQRSGVARTNLRLYLMVRSRTFLSNQVLSPTLRRHHSHELYLSVSWLLAPALLRHCDDPHNLFLCKVGTLANEGWLSC